MLLLASLLSLALTAVGQIDEIREEVGSSLNKRVKALGPLRVHPKNPRYFTDGTKDRHGNAKAIYLTGSHTWNNLVDFIRAGEAPNVFDNEAYLDFLGKYGHNYFRLWTWGSTTWDTGTNDKKNVRDGEAPVFTVAPLPWARTGPGLALDGKPKFDLRKFDDTYFERLRMRVSDAGDRGIYVSVMLFEGWAMYWGNNRVDESKGWAWRSHPFHPANNINGIDAAAEEMKAGPCRLGIAPVNAIQKAYLCQVVDTVNDLDNVLYEVINEGGEKEWDWWVANTVREYERTKPKQHAIGITGHGSENLADMLASPADWISPGSKDGFKSSPPAWEGKKVSILDTDHIWGIGGDVSWVWKAFVRGHNPIFMDPYDGRILGKGQPEQWNDLRSSLGKTLQLAERLNLAAMIPCDKLASTKFCLANPGAEYVVFVPKTNVDVDLSDTYKLFQVEWIHPSEGTVTRGELVRGGNKQSFQVPFSGPAVLYLRAQ